jgi:UDP-N-acetyl-D-mannosaminuronic acid dehydrogenase
VKSLSNTLEPSVCVVGLGTIGLPVAKYMHQHGCKVVGYDISDAAVEEARKHIDASNDFGQIPREMDTFVVCVSTKQRDGKPDASFVFDACHRISNRSPELVSIESTVPIGTCRELRDSVFDENTHVVHAPHRFWPEDPVNHGVQQLRVIGAMDNESMRSAKLFYESLDIPMLEVEPIEIAEMAKITENAYRYVQIAFAEELRSICQCNNIDFNQLRNACNSKWNTHIPEAREGIGGTCLPKDILYVVEAARRAGLEPDLLMSAICADKKYVDAIREPFART